MERHSKLAQAVLRKEEVSLLKLGLATGDLSLEEREKMFSPQLWATRLEELELQAVMCFVPSATKLCVGHLLVGSNQADDDVEAVARRMTGAGDQPETPEVQVNSPVATLPSSHSTISITDSAHPIAVNKWLEGSSCLARSPEDGVWKRAKVIYQDSAEGDVKVVFVDYSSSAVVGPNDIVSSVDELSEKEKSKVDKVVLVANAVKDLKQVEVNKSKVTVPDAVDVELVNDQSNPNPYCITNVEAALDDDSLLVETSERQTSLDENIIVAGGQVADEVSFFLGVSPGQECVAKWSDDDVWYRAQVAEVGPDAKVLVVFTDYGNSAYVGEGEVVAGVEDIPAGEEKDVHLVEASGVIDDTNLVTEKNITEAADSGIVEEKKLKSEYAEETQAIEKDEEVEDEAKHIVEVEIQASPSKSQLLELKIDDFCVACFSEDNVW